MSFPQAPLNVTVELNLAGTWTAITHYAMQRSGTAAPMTITRGRADETAKATPCQYTAEWNNRDGRFSPRNPTGPYYGQLTRNTPVRVSVPGPGVYLRFADDATSWAQTSDSASLQITGSIDIRIDLMLDNYMPSVLCSKWGSTGTAWALSLNADGSVTLTWFDGTTNHQVSTAGLAVLPLGRSMIRATLNSANGNVQFFTAATMAGSQTLLAGITGSGATSVSAAVGQLVVVGDASTFDASFGTQGCQGQVYEFRLYNGIAGTLEADPVFTAQTAGATTFTDAQGNGWSIHGTGSLNNRSYRGHFEASGLPQRWDTTGTDIWTPVQASGVLRRIQQGSAPLKSVMRRGVPAWQSIKSSGMTSLSSLPSTIAYWPAEDNKGASQVAAGLAQNTDGLLVPAMMVAGNVAFQGTAGSPSADSVFGCSAQLAQISTSTWTGRVPAYSSNGTAAMVTFLLAIPSGGLSGSPTLIEANWSGGGALQLQYSTTASGTLQAVAFSGVTSFFMSGSLTGVNGGAFMAQLYQVTTGTPKAFWNIIPLGRGQSLTSGSTTSGTSSGQMTSVVVNPFAANCGATELGHIWVEAAFSSAGVQDALPALTDPHIQNLLNAYSGEAAGNRFSRLCKENGLAPRVYGYPAVTAAMGAQQVDTLANLLQSVEDADRGQLYEPAEALGAGYRTLASLCNQPPALTLDYSLATLGGDGSAGLAPTDDDQFTINDVTITKNSGTSYQYQVTSGPLSISPPPAGVGDYASSLTVYCAYDSQTAQIAAWMAHIGSADAERYPVLPLNLARAQLASLQTAILAVRTGDHVQIINPPSWLPPGPVDQLAWGSAERLGGYWWLLSWNAIPELPYEVAAAGTARADTAGSQIHGWSFTVSGTPINNTYFIVSTGQAASIFVGDTLTDTSNPGTTFTVTALSPPSGGFVNVSVTPTAGTTMSNPDVVTQVMVSATATTLSVSITAGDLWTTNAPDFPFFVRIAGERIKVTAISGSSSPQSFTVTRSQNGVVKTQAVAAVVNIDPQGIAALAGAA